MIFYYTFSSSLKSQYYNLKSNFSDQNEYLAVVNESGLWIKEEIDNTINIVHAKKFKGNIIENVTITQTNSKFKMPNTIIAETANIAKKQWELINVKIINHKGERSKNSSIKYMATFDGEIIANLFSNVGIGGIRTQD